MTLKQVKYKKQNNLIPPLRVFPVLLLKTWFEGYSIFFLLEKKYLSALGGLWEFWKNTFFKNKLNQ